MTGRRKKTRLAQIRSLGVSRGNGESGGAIRHSTLETFIRLPQRRRGIVIGAICAHPSRFAGPFLLQRERARASLDFSLTTRTPLVLTY